MLCLAGLRLGGRRVTRTTYRPDPWRFAEWAVASCGVLSAVLLFVNVGYDPSELNPSIYPLSWPTLPLVPAAAILLAGAAGFLAPPPAPPNPPVPPTPAHHRTAHRGIRMITFDRVSVVYDGADEPVLRDVNLSVDEGELCLVVGHTGVGKSTLLGAVNGLVPHFTGGTLYGTVTVDGRDTADHPPRELADVVGVVGQDPLDGFVTDTVEEELAYAMEQLAISPTVMRKRVEETLDLLGLADLRHRALYELSGGQQQRVAIGSVLTAHPRVLVLDEPTSALDPTAAEEVLAAVTRLVHDLGVTVLLAEHRLERVVQYADRVIHLPGNGRVVSGTPSEIFTTSSIAPPIVELGRAAGWSPLPLSVRDDPQGRPTAANGAGGRGSPAGARGAGHTGRDPARCPGITVAYRGVPAVREVDLDLRAGRSRR